MSDITVGVRPWKGSDKHYVFQTWLDSHQQVGTWAQHLDRPLYWSSHRQVVQRLTSAHSVLVAFDPTETNVILGYVCGDDYPAATLVHYIYVPSKMRHWGVAKVLMQSLGWTEGKPIIASHRTPTSATISNRHLLVYNPYLKFKEFRSALHGKATPRQDAQLIKYTTAGTPKRPKPREPGEG